MFRKIRKFFKKIEVDERYKNPELTNDFIDRTSIALYRYKQLKTCDFNKIENLVLGPCYGRVDWVNEDYDINFAMGGQDLYYSYKTYKMLIRKLPNLKNLVLFYGVFSPGLDNEYTGLFYASVAQHYFFKIPYQNREPQKIFNFKGYEKLITQNMPILEEHIKDYTYDYIGFERKEKVDDEFARKVAEGHYKNNQRKRKKNQFLEKIIKHAGKKNIKVFIVFSPYTKVYRQEIPSDEILFESVYKITERYKNTEIINLYNAQDFDEKTDFVDYEHLNRKGAEKCTRIIRDKIMKNK